MTPIEDEMPEPMEEAPAEFAGSGQIDLTTPDMEIPEAGTITLSYQKSQEVGADGRMLLDVMSVVSAEPNDADLPPPTREQSFEKTASEVRTPSNNTK